MKDFLKTAGLWIFTGLSLLPGTHTLAQQQTYCNPMNLDYGYTPVEAFMANGKHRTTADPVITPFEGNYYLFATNQQGYWWGPDLLHWNYVPRSFVPAHDSVPKDITAPATLVLGDTLFVIGSTYSKDFTLWMSTDPRSDTWQPAVDSFAAGAWDPAFFADTNGRVYIYFGSSNVYPIYGQQIDHHTLQPVGERRELLSLHPDRYGWERFGEYNDNTFLDPFIEGAWMNKHDGRYYLQFAAPGTEFKGYADGVYVSGHPLKGFTYQRHNPFSYKPGGFARGAGHGSTFQDYYGNWWHVATMAISVKNNFERRIGLWPAGFDNDGILFCNTAYGDYPHKMPSGKQNPLSGGFSGWMLLNYNKPVQVSSTLGGHEPNFAVNEDIKTYWSARTGDAGEWLQSDLGAVSTVYAIQVNYADQDATFAGKSHDVFHQYQIYASGDGDEWTVVVDKSRNRQDVPHDYVELPQPVEARFLRIGNLRMPTGKFALSGFRVFGLGHGTAPDSVGNFTVLRGESERRNAWIKWRIADEATGYVIYTGTDPGKLYTSIMVYGSNEYYFNGMDKDLPYYFTIEAFNENGIGSRTGVIRVE